MLSRGKWAGVVVLVVLGLALGAWKMLWNEPRPEAAVQVPAEPPVGELTSSRPASQSRSLVREEAPKSTVRNIEGRVVDGEGKPLRGVMVVVQAKLPGTASPRELLRQPTFATTTTDAAGHFELKENPKAAGTTLELAVPNPDGYEPYRSDAIEWGTRDVVITLQLGDVLEVRTVDEITGEPVDPCTVSVGIAVTSGPPRTAQAKPLRRSVVVGRPGPGVQLLAPVPAREILLLIVPKDQRHARITHAMLRSEAPYQTVTVRVPREQHRSLRVLGSDGKPRANVAFQLVRSEELKAVERSTPIVDAEWTGVGHVSRVRMQGGFTDANGESLLYGARGVLYELVLDPPGRTFRDIVVDDAYAPLVITLDLGAEIHGKLGPPEALALMVRPKAGDPNPRVHAPAFWLTPVGSTTPLPTQIPIAEDGSFAMSGLAPGSYALRMFWYDAKSNAHHEAFADITELRAGEMRELSPRLDHLQTTHLDGFVTWEGQPYRNGQVELRGTGTNGQGAPITHTPVTVTTDAAGRFTARVAAGTWRLAIPALKTLHQNMQWLESTTSATVRLGAPAEADFTLHRTKLVVRVLDAAGAPAPNRDIQFRFERSAWQFEMPTDANGRAEFECAPAGPGSVFARKNGQWTVDLGHFVTPEGRSTHEVEVRLPD